MKIFMEKMARKDNGEQRDTGVTVRCEVIVTAEVGSENGTSERGTWGRVKGDAGHSGNLMGE
jgi:hypothetical protein